MHMDINAVDELVAGRTVAGQTSPLLLTPEQAATCLAICRTKLYELLRTGELESVRIGSSRRIPAAALAEYVQRLRNASEVMVTTDRNNQRIRPTVLG
jgi:excisionase family DNA binding protein